MQSNQLQLKWAVVLGNTVRIMSCQSTLHGKSRELQWVAVLGNAVDVTWFQFTLFETKLVALSSCELQRVALSCSEIDASWNVCVCVHLEMCVCVSILQSIISQRQRSSVEANAHKTTRDTHTHTHSPHTRRLIQVKGLFHSSLERCACSTALRPTGVLHSCCFSIYCNTLVLLLNTLRHAVTHGNTPVLLFYPSSFQTWSVARWISDYSATQCNTHRWWLACWAIVSFVGAQASGARRLILFVGAVLQGAGWGWRRCCVYMWFRPLSTLSAMCLLFVLRGSGKGRLYVWFHL